MIGPYFEGCDRLPAILLDYKVSQPSNGGLGGILPGDIPLPVEVSTPNGQILLADIGLFLTSGPPNRVELSITVGLDRGRIFTRWRRDLDGQARFGGSKRYRSGVAAPDYQRWRRFRRTCWVPCLWMPADAPNFGPRCDSKASYAQRGSLCNDVTTQALFG
jgi:hypothetical protein